MFVLSKPFTEEVEVEVIVDGITATQNFDYNQPDTNIPCPTTPERQTNRSPLHFAAIPRGSFRKSSA